MDHIFKLLYANDERNINLLASMHHLRWNVFHQELHWTTGLINRNCMEFDDYDRSYARYIVRINSDQQVDACCRLMPTDQPYMLAECYPEFIETCEIPKSEKTWEVSRFASSEEARKQTKGTIMAQLIVAMIEFGLVHDINNFISLTTDNLVPIIKRAGWDSLPLGSKRRTPDDFSYSLTQTVSFEMLERVKQKNKIEGFLLYDLTQTKEELLAKYHESQEETSLYINGAKHEEQRIPRPS